MKAISCIFLLSSCASAFCADDLPPVFLSHCYVALDQVTYDAVRNSAEIAALAGVEERHTVAGDRSWSGLYVYGRQTYLEFFAADTLPNGTLKEDSGLGLLVEKAAGVIDVAARLRPVFGSNVEIGKQVRTISGGNIPWFIETAVDTDRPEAMPMWVMEVDPGYLTAMHPGSLVQHPLSREQYLSWNFRPDRLLDAVVGVRAALNTVEMTQLANELELIGWSVHRTGGGFVAKGPEVKIEVIPASSRLGIQQVALRLRHSVAKRAIAVGSMKLILEGKTGQLIF